MLKLKASLILLLITLNSCGIPKIRPIERCVISFDNNKCRCHEYTISDKTIGRTSDSYDKPIEYCDKGVVFIPKEWGALRSWFFEIQEFLKDRKGNKKVRKKLKKYRD